MDIAQLKTLIHVAELGSLSKAADRLNIAQPALSRQIRLLESELGVSLFERHGRGMVLTLAGNEILEHATRIMGELESIRKTVAEKRGELLGLLRVGMTPTISQIVTVPLVRQLKRVGPTLSLRFNSAFSGYLIDWIQRGSLDIAFTYNPPASRTLRISPILVENCILVGPVDAGLCLERPISFSSLHNMEFVLPSAPHGLRTIAEDCAKKAGIALLTSIEVDSFTAMLDLVKKGFGYTILPLAATYDLIQQDLVSGAPLIDPIPEREVVAVYSADRPVNRSTRVAGDCFLAIAGDLFAQGIWGCRLIGR
jgi:LysR family nitrogen assimilation transcriptional regulator